MRSVHNDRDEKLKTSLYVQWIDGFANKRSLKDGCLWLLDDLGPQDLNFLNRFPTTNRSNPLRTVSTSGNSGIFSFHLHYIALS